MKRKWIRVAAAILAAALVLVTLVSCVGDAGDQPGGDTGDAGNHAGNGGSGGGQNDPHTHTFSAEWSSDSTYHWHAATCGHADQTEGKAVHTYENGACTVCGKAESVTPPTPHDHTFSAEWSSDSMYHWHAATCEHTDQVAGKAPHTYENGVCTVCGKAETVTPPAPHEHTFSSEWSSDDAYHWHAATCEHTDQVAGKAPHTYENGACVVCGRAEPEPSEGLAFERYGDVYRVVGIGTCTDSDLVIPAVYNGLPVTGIASEAFEDCTSLTSITIPNSVTSIGYCAFYNCTSLTYNVYDNAKYLGNDQNPYMVLVCATDEGIPSCEIHPDAKIICDDAFLVCASLTSITIPSSVISIGDFAFAGCTSLVSIVISDSVTSIGEGTFSGCTSLTSMTIPSSVTSIDSRAFENCTSLTSIVVQEGNPVYQSARNCVIETESKTLIVGCNTSAIPDDGSVTEIGWGAFFYCTSLTTITIPNSVTGIGDSAFLGCTSLTSITIGNGVTSIGLSAFKGCTSLESITIPNRVTSIVWYAFSDCTSLTTITIPNSVTSIGDNAFSGCTSLASITIPNSVTSIGNEAFSGCTSLTSITIPDSVTEIGYRAFYGCPIEFATIPAWACDDISNSALKTVVITSGDIVGNYAFSGCGSLSSITIPDSVTSIGFRTFYGCTSLTSIVIPDSVTEIGYEAFKGCTSLTSIVIPNSVTRIGSYAFEDCTSLASVIFERVNGWRQYYGGSPVDVSDPARNAEMLKNSYLEFWTNDSQA